MKNNVTITNWLFTPFKFIAGTKALLLGLMLMIILSILGYLGNTHFDGAIDIHYGCPETTMPYIIHLSYQFIGWICLAVVFYITALIVTKSKVRLIDIAGTIALAKTPLTLAAITGFIPSFHICFGNPDTLNIAMMVDILKDNIILICIIGFVTLIIAIWSILLMYNAYSVSANVKGVAGIASFVIALLLAEIISQIILYLVIPVLS